MGMLRAVPAAKNIAVKGTDTAPVLWGVWSSKEERCYTGNHIIH